MEFPKGGVAKRDRKHPLGRSTDPLGQMMDGVDHVKREVYLYEVGNYWYGFCW